MTGNKTGLAAFAVIVLLLLAAIVAVTAEGGSEMEIKAELQPGDYTETEVVYGERSETRTLTVTEVDGDDVTFILSNGETAVEQIMKYDDLVNDFLIDGSAFSDVKRTGKVADVHTFMGVRDCYSYDVSYGGQPGMTVIADRETGVVYNLAMDVDGVRMEMEVTASTMFEGSEPGPVPQLKDQVKGFKDVVVGDFYRVSGMTVSPDGKVTEQPGLLKVTITSIDRAAGKLTCERETPEGKTVETVTWAEFISGIVMDPKENGLVAGISNILSTNGGIRECTEYTHPDGVQSFLLGKDTNIRYMVVFQSETLTCQFLDSTSLMVGDAPW